MSDLIAQSATYFINAFQLTETEEVWTEEKLAKVLTPIIKQMLDRDFERLLHICYRIDLGENNLKKILHESPPETLALDLTLALIRRQVKKIELRNHYKGL